MEVAVIDYGVGNLASVVQGLEAAGLQSVITQEEDRIYKAKALVLPGVGAFGQGMENLRQRGLIPVLEEAVSQGKPFLGICLGMQLLFSESEEYGHHKGLGFLSGRIERFPEGLKIPHMGWNTLTQRKAHPLLTGVKSGSYVYFVHSYVANGCRIEDVVATSHYGVEFPAIVCFNNIMGIQFHPEKSSHIGLTILKNFGELVRAC